MKSVHFNDDSRLGNVERIAHMIRVLKKKIEPGSVVRTWVVAFVVRT